jgi:hypothetical protein
MKKFFSLTFCIFAVLLAAAERQFVLFEIGTGTW